MASIIVNTANAQRVGYEVLTEILMPPPPVDYLWWAEEHIVFSERESQFHGRYTAICLLRSTCAICLDFWISASIRTLNMRSASMLKQCATSPKPSLRPA